MVAIRRQIQNNLKFTSGYGNPKNYLTIHQTDNFSKGANAAAHANLQSRLGIGHSWHWTVDDREAVQSYENNVKCWHAGDGGGAGNMQSIAIEICVNSDGNYDKTFDNAAQLAAKLLKENNIPIARMVQHNYWSGKNCPSVIRNKNQWNTFVGKVRGYMSGSSSKPSTSKPTSSGKLVVDGDFGPASVKKMQQILGTLQDGFLGGQWSGYKKYHSRLRSISYGSGGSTSVKALQRKLGVSVDGLMGPNTIKALQRKLKVTPVNGYFGPKTATAFQKALNSGKLWPTTSTKKKTTTKKKSNAVVAQEVINGKWGNGQARVNSLKKAGYNPTTIQKLVNQKLK